MKFSFQSLNPTYFADLGDFAFSAAMRFMFVGVKWDVSAMEPSWQQVQLW